MAIAPLERLATAVAGVKNQVLTPALVFDLDAIRHNVRAMLARVGHPERWRPHIKTVKASAILKVLLDEGVRRFKCATVSELAVLLRTAASVGVAIDVLLAYPQTRPAAGVVFALARRHPGATVGLLADDPTHLRALDEWFSSAEAGSTLSVMFDVDLGMGRTGCPPSTWQDASNRLDDLRNLKFAGLHGYDGHFRWTQKNEAHQAYDTLCDLAESIGTRTPVGQLITSGTHSYDHALTHRRLAQGPWSAQVSPGTLVLSDLRSHEACKALGLRQGVFVLSRAISVGRPGVVTLDAGSKAISPDVPSPNAEVVGHPNWIPSSPSEEHLPVNITDGAVPIRGAMIWLIPAHACTTVNLHRRALLVEGDRIVGDCEIEAQGHYLWAEPTLEG